MLFTPKNTEVVDCAMSNENRREMWRMVGNILNSSRITILDSFRMNELGMCLKYTSLQGLTTVHFMRHKRQISA